MNWYKEYKTSSSLGITIGKWLNYARNGFIDLSAIMNDVNKAIQDDSVTIIDIDALGNALSEAHQFLLSQGQTDPYNAQQIAIVDAIKNLGSNPQQTFQNEEATLDDNLQTDQ